MKIKTIAVSVFLVIASSVIRGQSSAIYMTEPSLSSDRKEIAFVSGGDIWTVPAEGGTAQLLVSHPATESKPLFSPDGKLLAFGSNRTGNGDIYLLELTSGNVRRLTFDDGGENLDAWSRDGAWLYFSSNARDIAGMNDIYRVAATGGTPMQVSADRYTTEFQAAPLADGSIIFAARGNSSGQWWRKGHSHLDESELWLKSGDQYSQLTQRGAKQMWPMATADGSRISFVSGPYWRRLRSRRTSLVALCLISSLRCSNELFADATRRPRTSAARVAMRPIAMLTICRDGSLIWCSGSTGRRAAPSAAPASTHRQTKPATASSLNTSSPFDPGASCHHARPRATKAAGARPTHAAALLPLRKRQSRGNQA